MPAVLQIKKYEKKILSEEKEIEKLEEKIEDKEDSILAIESRVFKILGPVRFVLGGISKFEAQFLKKGFLRRFAKHKIIYSLTTIVSIVLVWRGIWALADSTPGVSNPLISIPWDFLSFGLLIELVPHFEDFRTSGNFSLNL